MCKYFLAVCITALCAVDCLFAMNTEAYMNAETQQPMVNSESLSNKDFVNEQINTFLDQFVQMGYEIDKEKLSKCKRVAINFVRKKGREAFRNAIKQLNRLTIDVGRVVGQIIAHLQCELDEE